MTENLGFTGQYDDEGYPVIAQVPFPFNQNPQWEQAYLAGVRAGFDICVQEEIEWNS